MCASCNKKNNNNIPRNNHIVYSTPPNVNNGISISEQRRLEALKQLQQERGVNIIRSYENRG